MVRRELDCNIWSHALEFDRVRPPPPLANGQERSGLQHLESCTGVWVGKTPPLLIVSRDVVCKIWSHALEFVCVRLPPFYWAGEKWFAVSGAMHWIFVG